MTSRPTAEPSGPRSADTTIDYCGEQFIVDPGRPFVIGRDGHLVVDDNPYLHRCFLVVHHHAGLWWLNNEGTHLSARVTSGDRGFSATLGPGATMPLLSGRSSVVFSAGPTTYEIHIDVAADLPSQVDTVTDTHGQVTLGAPVLTDSQKILIVVLAEQILRQDGSDSAAIPSSAQAAARLGWSLTKFNRKLDNVCDKLDRIGVSGLRAGGGRLATTRRVKLVEYAVASRLVTRADLVLIDAETARTSASR